VNTVVGEVAESEHVGDILGVADGDDVDTEDVGDTVGCDVVGAVVGDEDGIDEVGLAVGT
jgi:hypothetical protein